MIGLAASRRPGRKLSAVLAACSLFCLPGCVERALVVTSEPSGANVTINQQWKGKTPYVLPFKHYGVYDIWLEHPGFEENGRLIQFYPLHVGEPIPAPAYQYAGADFVTEVLLPATWRDQHNLHYVLERVDRADEVADVLARADQLREASAARNLVRRNQDSRRGGISAETASPSSGDGYDSDAGIDATPPLPREVPIYGGDATDWEEPPAIP
ncbi:MAG: PEGA domain-containing protein [Planctomycetota bacterium]|jgi:hypothetical protein|nr:PEGA domain-containing protein [Planctomycetota bacterium]